LYLPAGGIDSSFSNLSSKVKESPIKGIHIRGPVKHVDRSIEKVSVTVLTFFHCSTFSPFSKFAHQRISGAPVHFSALTSVHRCIAHTAETSKDCAMLCGAA
jgi:hypothetical protein